MISIGRTVILVDDHEAAMTFYADAFGSHTLFDDSEAVPGFRAVHIGPQDVRSPGLWLIKATSAESSSRIGRQTGGEPVLVLYTDDLESDLARLRSLQATIVKDLASNGTESFAHVLDNSGNEIVLVQLAAEPELVTASAYELVE